MDFEFEELERNNPEFFIQRGIMDHLLGQIRKGNEITPCTPPFDNLFATSIYQGRNEAEGFFLKMLGVKPGMSDILAFYPHPKRGEHPALLFGASLLEVKAEKGRMSPDQYNVMGKCQWLGIPYVVVRSVVDVHNHFVKQGLIPRHNAIREADTRTKAQKYQDAFNAFKPI